MIGSSSPTTTILLAITSSTVIKSAYSIGIFSPHERAADDEIFGEKITNESEDISLFDSLFGPSTAVGKITTQQVTICQTLEECTSAVNELDMMPLRVGDYPTKGCFVKKGRAFWSQGDEAEISDVDLPPLQQRIFCNNEGARTETFTNPFPSFIGPTWTAVEYYNGEEQQLDEPISGTSVTLTFDIMGDMRGETGCNSYFGRYKDLTSSSFTIDGAIAQTLIGCDGDLGMQEYTYLNNWYSNDPSSTTTINWSILEDGSLELKNRETNTVIALYKSVCSTKEDCDVAAQEISIQVGYTSPDFPTKGCFTKNDVAYWSEGAEFEMARVDLPGIQERVFCGKSSSSDDDTASPTESQSPTESPGSDISVFGADIDSTKNNGLPPTKISTSGATTIKNVGIAVGAAFLSLMF